MGQNDFRHLRGLIAGRPERRHIVLDPSAHIGMGFAVPDSTWCFLGKPRINQNYIIACIDHIILKGRTVFHIAIKMFHAILAAESEALCMEAFFKKIRDSLMPIIQDASAVKEETIVSYAKHIIEGISEVRELIYVMLKGDEGEFLRQLTDLISRQNLKNALSFFDIKDSAELRLYYEFQSAGMAAFIIKWILDEDLSEEKAAKLLAQILLQSPGKKPILA